MDDERGFTLIEILVVILIIGILAAIAIPSFISEKGKANDASAKSYVRNMQTAQEAYYADNNAYSNSLSSLQSIEPALNDTPGRTAPSARNTPRGGYTVTATSTSGVSYTVTRNADGTTSRTCDSAGVAGCTAARTW